MRSWIPFVRFLVFVAITTPLTAHTAPLRSTIESALTSHSPWLLPLIFIAGIVSVATPCVLPMLPITLGTLGVNAGCSRSTAAIRSASYVAGIVVTYTTLGLIAGLTGTMLGNVFTHPITHIAIAAFFIALACSMFGAYEIRIPSAIGARLQTFGNSSIIGAFAAGLVAGFLALPCIGPVLAGLLAYIGTTQSVVLGGVFLATYALGFGLPFFIIGIGWLRIPKRGSWMNGVKYAIGVILLIGASWYIWNAIPALHTRTTSWCDEGEGFHCLASTCKTHEITVVDFMAPWCISCGELDRRTLNHPDVVTALDRYGLVRINVDRVTDAQERYKISGLPNVLFLDRTCTPIPERIEGYVDHMEFLLTLRRAELAVQ